MSADNDERDDDLLTHDDDGGEDQAPDLGSGEAEYVVGEEKKPLSKATVALFLIFGAAAAASYFLLVKQSPESAEAAAVSADPKAGQVIKQYMSDKSQSAANLQKILRDTDAVVKQFLTYPSVTQVPLAALRANPFQLAPEKPADPAAVSKKDEEREKKRREEERAAVLRAVQGLQLQSVMHSGKTKSCMVNNTLYTEGQTIEGFTVERIAANSVVVRQGGYRFELRMQR